MTARIDPDLFRKQVGQYSDRWYIDPLPGCDIAPAAPDWDAPSVSTIKKVSGKDWTEVSLQRCAQWIYETKPDFSRLEQRGILDQLREAKGAGLDVASARGTEIHAMFELFADGGSVVDAEWENAAARQYRRTVLRCLEEQKPHVRFSEFVAIRRGDALCEGYGGTGDAVWDLDGELFLVDYKSRTNKTDRYIEEAWQIAAYAKADYWVVAGPDGEPMRIKPPVLAGGLVVSISPSSYQMHPVDLDAAFEGFAALRHLWSFSKAGIGSVFGKAWTNPTPTRDWWIRNRIETIKEIDITPLLERWPEGVPKPKQQVVPYSDDQIDLIIPAVEWAEKIDSAPWPEADPGRVVQADTQRALDWTQVGNLEQPEDLVPFNEPVMPDEGDDFPKGAIVLQNRFDALTDSQKSWIGDIVEQANVAHLDIRPGAKPSSRRVFIGRALILACERKVDGPTLTKCLQSALGSEISLDTPFGAAVGLLDWEQASTFAALVGVAHPGQSVYEQPSPPKAAPKSRSRKASGSTQSNPTNKKGTVQQ